MGGQVHPLSWTHYTQRNAHTALITLSLLIRSYREGSWYKIVKYIEFWVLENIDKPTYKISKAPRSGKGVCGVSPHK